MAISADPARLRLVLERLPETIYEPGFVPEAPLVRFEAYRVDARIFGWVHLRADRLSDLVNACTELELLNAEVEDLAAGTTSAPFEGIVVQRDDLVAIHASGPRGDESRRRRTRVHPIAMQSGRYLIGGHLHVPPGENPNVSLATRPPMIPLTEAWIEYWPDGKRQRQWVGTLVMNRDRADWIKFVSDDDLAFAHVRPL